MSDQDNENVNQDPVPDEGTPIESGENLLAQGIERYFPEGRYTEASPGYGRIVHDLGERELPRSLPEVMRGTLACGESKLSDPLDSLLLMDIESLGFIGRPLFLIGSLFAHFTEEVWKLKLVQYLARDYSEEEAVIDAFLTEARDCDLWITYNGRTFDLPFVRLRATQFLLKDTVSEQHLDLLPVARRMWREVLPNCKLQTIETYILERPRGHDIDGGRIPAAYHSFVRTGEPFDMLNILKHNAADLVSLLDIYQRMLVEIKDAD